MVCLIAELESDPIELGEKNNVGIIASIATRYAFYLRDPSHQVGGALYAQTFALIRLGLWGFASPKAYRLRCGLASWYRSCHDAPVSPGSRQVSC
jgi:hypothetical protein